MRSVSNQTFWALACAAAAAAALTHCGKSSKSAAPAPAGGAVNQESGTSGAGGGTSALESTTDPRYNDLKGTWRTEACAKLDAGSAQQAKVFTKAHMVSIIDTYSDQACATIKERFFIVASYKTGDLVGTNPWRKVDYTVTGLLATFADAATLKSLNGAKVCGFTDWVAGVPKDLTNNVCMTTTPLAIALFKNPSDFNVYQIVGGKLLSGLENTDHDGLTEAHRPVALADATSGLTKQTKDDPAVNSLGLLLASNGIKAAAAEATSALRTLKIAVPELPAAIDPAATSHLEVVLVPTNPFKQTQVFQAKTVNSFPSPAISVDTYAVTVLQVEGTSTTPKASGTASITMTQSNDQPITIHLKNAAGT